MKRRVYAFLLSVALLFSSNLPVQAAIPTTAGLRVVYDGTIVANGVHLRSTKSVKGWTNVVCTLSKGTGYYDHGRCGNDEGIRWRCITVASGLFDGRWGYVDDRYTSQGVPQY